MELSSLLMAGILGLFRIENSSLANPTSREQIARLKQQQEQQALALRRKSQEVADLLMAMERKNKALAQIKRDVLEAIEKARHQEDKSILLPLLNINDEINDNLESDSLLVRFEQEYDAANDGFLQRLSSRFPDLNQSERMTCVYLRKNLSTKEIASILHLTVRGVETIRYHLRQKLGVGREEKLSSFLGAF